MSTKTLVFCDGSVYSPVDPYATAMVLTETAVDWVGSDAGADSIYDNSMHKVELVGDLLTPAFFHGGATVQSQDELAILSERLMHAGYASTSLFLPQSACESINISASPLHTFVYAIISGKEDIEQLVAGIHGVQIRETSIDLTSLLQKALDHHLKVSLVPRDEVDIEKFLSALSAFNELDRFRLAPRLDGISSITSEYISVARDLGVALGFSSQIAENDSSIRQAVAAGALIFLGSDVNQESRVLGWELALTHVVRTRPEYQLSARATFNAMTRGVYRAVGESNPTFGQLGPQSMADVARWKVTELMVQTADDRVAAWSTDPRARIPLLPVLEKDNLPELVDLLIAGQFQDL